MAFKTEPIVRLHTPPDIYAAKAVTNLTAAIQKTNAAAAAAAKTQRALANSTAAVTKAVTNAALSFDELHVAGRDETVQKKTASGSSARKSTAQAKEDTAETLTVWERCRDALEAVFEQIRARLTELSALFAPSVRAWGAAFEALRGPVSGALDAMAQSARGLWEGALAPLGRYLLETFAPGVANAFSQTVAPALAQVGALAAEVLAGGFTAACNAVSGAVDTLALPALEAVRTAFTGLCEGLAQAWDTYGAALLEGVSAFFEGLGALWETFYSGWLLPGFEALAGVVDGLWQEHLAPLWQSFTNLLAELGVLLLDVWNNMLAPLLQRLSDIFAPALSAVFSGAALAVRGLLETAAAVALGVTEAFRGLVEFLAGVFTGDWARAWEGVRAIAQNVWDGIVALVKGAVNLVIDCVNALVRGVTAALNGVIGALNTIHVTIPEWVPVYGGRQFGVALPGVSAPQIPRLAQGAVIPPGAEFLAVLGDQRHGRNLEAPEDLIRQIVREEGASAPLAFTAEQPIELSLDGDVFYRAMARVKANRGMTVGGAFAETY